MALSTARGEKARTALEKRAFKRALSLFREAALRVPAYKDFLRKAKIHPRLIETPEDFARVPPVDKHNYISAYSLAEMSWDGKFSAKCISSSSGSTGVPFYWPRGRMQDVGATKLYQGIFERIYGTKRGKTLCVDLFALGTWIAGLEFYNAAKRVADFGSDIAILTPGIEKIVARDAVAKFIGDVDRVILAGYPPFIKDVLEACAEAGIDWKRTEARLLGAGESFSEIWRERVLQEIGQQHSLSHFVNVYGMAEAGVVAHETPLTIFARKHAHAVPELAARLVHEGQLCPVYQYDPLVRYFEIGPDDSIVLTASAGLPLVRYNTRDRGGIMTHAMLHRSISGLTRPRELRMAYDFPYPAVYLFGRKDLSISLYALNIYVENIKQALETYPGARSFSGFFVMGVGHTKDLDQRFEITVELAEHQEPKAVHTGSLTRHIVRTLRSVNSEYAKLHTTIGAKADPKVAMVRHGTIQTVPGKKHKWVKRP